MAGKKIAQRPSNLDGVAAFPFPSAELLERGLSALGFASDEVDAGSLAPVPIRDRSDMISLLNRYIRELELFNAVFDLVGAEPGSERGRQDLVVRHLLDSLAPWATIATLAASAGPDAQIADVGSGAGFPGIPLAIAFPNLRFTLIERMSKRCAFLQNCVAILGLKNVTVLNVELEKAPTASFDVVVFRAFRPLDAEMTRSLLALTRSADGSRPNGVLAAWKARREKILEEMAGISGVIGSWEAKATPVPFLENEERNLVVISAAASQCRPS